LASQFDQGRIDSNPARFWLIARDGLSLFMATKIRPNSDKITRVTVPFELKATGSADGAAGTFEGYAAGIHNIDAVGDMILPGAFNADLPRFLQEGAVCYQHDWTMPIGKCLQAKEDPHGLFVKAQISNTTCGADCMTLIRDGVIKKMSIGYRVKDYEIVDRAGLMAYCMSAMTPKQADACMKAYDEMELDSCFLLKSLKLYEFSPVTFPANNNADITGAKDLSSLAGLTFAEHSESVLAAVRGYTARAQKIGELRAKENRTLNAERKQDIESLVTELETSAKELREIVSAPSSTEGKLLHLEHLRHEARRLGCAV
jgi:HK97 family phage prohead protease